jgi:hypothetical protein
MKRLWNLLCRSAADSCAEGIKPFGGPGGGASVLKSGQVLRSYGEDQFLYYFAVRPQLISSCPSGYVLDMSIQGVGEEVLDLAIHL